MGDQETKVTELVWHVTVDSKTGYEHDDEVAWALFQEKRSDIEAAGAGVIFNRSFGSRGLNGVHTSITFIAPVASDPKKQVKPEQFFSETEEAAISIIPIVQLPENPPTLPKGAKEVTPPEAQNVAG